MVHEIAPVAALARDSLPRQRDPHPQLVARLDAWQGFTSEPPWLASTPALWDGPEAGLGMLLWNAGSVRLHLIDALRTFVDLSPRQKGDPFDQQAHGSGNLAASFERNP